MLPRPSRWRYEVDMVNAHHRGGDVSAVLVLQAESNGRVRLDVDFADGQPLEAYSNARELLLDLVSREAGSIAVGRPRSCLLAGESAHEPHRAIDIDAWPRSARRARANHDNKRDKLPGQRLKSSSARRVPRSTNGSPRAFQR